MLERLLGTNELLEGKYRILNEIGHGGMSVVYMAQNERINKIWAIKEVRKEGIDKEKFEVVKQGLIVETDMLKKLNHRGLPGIIDVINMEDSILIVMDYVEGVSLKKRLEEYGALPQEDVIKWGKQLCDVLDYLHTREPAIIYRDMKPANVMLKPDGDIVLIDFGTAREYKGMNLGDTTCLGTIGYAAPEQFGGRGETDARTDIYCLGATLYHLVTGCDPCREPYEIKHIREINPNLSSGLENIILKCVQKDPANRYQSCAELKYALEHYWEEDNAYRRRQKGKMAGFITCAALSVIMVVSGFVANRMADNMATDKYEQIKKEADESNDYNEKIVLYGEAIAIKSNADKSDAYLNLIEAYKNNDKVGINSKGVFTTDEEKELVTYIKANEEELRKNLNSYIKICYETGRLYWYYYDYGKSENSNTDSDTENDSNKVTRTIASVTWFERVIKLLEENPDIEFDNTKMTEIYHEIGTFYRDISNKIVEANDKGEYIKFWQSLNSLVDEAEKENEGLRFELYELVRSSIQQYAVKFKNDGVEKQEILEGFNKIEDIIKNTKGLDGEIDKIRKKSENLLADTKAAIDSAYEN